MSEFVVERHGGRSCDKWRVLLKTEDEQKANERYSKEHLKMRQGGLRLLKDGEVVKKNAYPLLRSRW